MSRCSSGRKIKRRVIKFTSTTTKNDTVQKDSYNDEMSDIFDHTGSPIRRNTVINLDSGEKEDKSLWKKLKFSGTYMFSCMYVNVCMYTYMYGYIYSYICI
jgi:hypothetical protein